MDFVVSSRIHYDVLYFPVRLGTFSSRKGLTRSEVTFIFVKIGS